MSNKNVLERHPVKNPVINHTESMCPICLKTIEAQVVEQDGRVYLKKVCPDHGPSSSYIWPDADHYRWMSSIRFPFKQPVSKLPPALGCPSDCGLCSIHLRHPTLVELEITQRCNLRCPVCFVSAGEAPPDPSLQTLEAMFQAVKEQSGTQVSIQLTGGEPTVREDLAQVIRLGRKIGFEAIEVNTNGLMVSRKPGYIEELVDAGISGIYLQFDGLTPQVYERIRGKELLQDKLQAIENCRAAGTQVVLAMTVIWGINHDQIGEVLDFALQNQDVIAGLALQPAFTSGRFDVTSERHLNMGDVIFMLAEQSRGMIQPYDLWPLACSHPLCSSATYLVKDQGAYKPFTRMISLDDYRRSFNTTSPQGSIFADIAARNFPDLAPGLSVVVMNYMDCMNVDLARLKECSMTVTMQDGRLIPFCAYQMTNLYGKRFYPVWGIEEKKQALGVGHVWR